jgi:hypothetical protein
LGLVVGAHRALTVRRAAVGTQRNAAIRTRPIGAALTDPARGGGSTQSPKRAVFGTLRLVASRALPAAVTDALGALVDDHAGTLIVTERYNVEQREIAGHGLAERHIAGGIVGPAVRTIRARGLRRGAEQQAETGSAIIAAGECRR